MGACLAAYSSAERAENDVWAHLKLALAAEDGSMEAGTRGDGLAEALKVVRLICKPEYHQQRITM